MKRHIGHSGSCSCTNCVYKSRSELPSVQHLIETGSKIDRLYYGKYLPLRERKLLGKLIRTRAVYDDVRTQLLSASGSSDQTKDTQEDDSTERSSAVTKIVDLVDRGKIGSTGTSKLSTCCSCCSCSSMKKIRIDKPRIHRHSVPYEAIEKYNLEAKKKGRARRNSLSTRIGTKLRTVRIKAKRVRSAPCACTLDISSIFKRLSKPHLKRKQSKEISTITTKTQSRHEETKPAKNVKIDRKALKLKCLCNFKLGKHSIKSIHKLKRSKVSAITGESEGTTGKRFRIRKDSVMLFRDKLKKKEALQDSECEPGICEPDECSPEDCYRKIMARSVGRGKRKKYPSKLSGTDVSHSHVSVGAKKKVSNANVGKRLKKMDTKCMCPPKTTSSGTISEERSRTVEVSQEEEPSLIGENYQIQTAKKIRKSMSRVNKQSKKHSRVKIASLCDCLPIITQEESQLNQPASITSKTTYIKSILTRKSMSHAKNQSKKLSKVQTAAICDCPPTTISLEGRQSNQTASTTSKSTRSRSIFIQKSMSHAIKQTKKLSKLKTAGVCDCPQATISIERSQINESPSQTSKPTYRTSKLMKKSISHPKKQSKKQSTGKMTAPCECPATESSLERSQQYQSPSPTTKSYYNKNILRQGELEPEIEESQYSPEDLKSHPSRQAVRIGSTFSFNIEFYKDKPTGNNEPDTRGSEVMYDSIPAITKQTSRRIESGHRSTQSILSNSQKNAYTGHGLKRCFCTLKIPKRKFKPHKPPSRKTMTSLNIRNVDVVGQMRETQTKPFKHQGANLVFVTPPLTSKPRSLLPYECEPFFCTPGECDPVECEKRIRLRKRKGNKYLSKETNTLRKPKTSTVALTTQYISNSSRKNQSSSPKLKRTKRQHSSEMEKPQLSLHRSNRQGVRIGSSFSFNIEFSKENICNEICNNQMVKPAPKKPRIEKKQYRHKGIKIHKPRLQHTTSQTMKTEKSKHTHTNKGEDKCICPENILKEQSTVTPLEYAQDSSLIMKHISIATEKEKKKHRNKATLLPYECEVGVCTPDECDPYECEKLIKMRNLKSRNESTCICPRAKSIKSSITKSATSYSKKIKVNTKESKSVSKNERDIITTPCRSDKQVVQIGSSISFNIEFYKERRPADELKTTKIIHDKRVKDKTQVNSLERANIKEASVQGSKRRAHHVSSSAEKQVKEKGISVSSAIKRCFCTLKLRNKDKLAKKFQEGNLHTSIPRHRNKGIRKRISNIENPAKIILKPNYCRSDVCDHDECCKETKHRHRKHLKHHTDTDNNFRKSLMSINRNFNRRGLKNDQRTHVVRDPNMYNQVNIQEEKQRQRKVHQHQELMNFASIEHRYNAGRNPQNYNQVYVREEKVMHRRIPQQSPHQGGRAGSFFDYNIRMTEQRGNKKLSATKKPNLMLKDKEIKANSKKKPEFKPPVIKVKKERKALNFGLKIKNAMGSFKRRMIAIVVTVKKIKIRRSVSQYTMVKVKKPKLGPPKQPVTAAFFQVIRDVDYKAVKSDLDKYDQNESNYLKVRAKEKTFSLKYRSRTNFSDECSRTQVFSSNSVLQQSSRNLRGFQRDRNDIIFPNNNMRNTLSKHSIRFNSSVGFDLKSTGDTHTITTSSFNQTCDIKENNFNGAQTMKSRFQRSYYALNVQVPFTKRRQTKSRNLEQFECEPGFCVPGKCDPIECLKRINSRFKSTKSSETDGYKNKSVGNSTQAKLRTKCKTAQSHSSAKPTRRSFRGRSKMSKQPNEIPGSSRQSISIGSKFSFKAEFYKQRNVVQPASAVKSRLTKSSGCNNHCEQSTTGVHAMKKAHQSTMSQKTIKHENKGIGPVIKRCFCTLKLQKTMKETSCKQTMANEPFGNVSLYQNQMMMTDKLKPYECAPGICVPGECNPQECYKLIQSRLNKGRKTQSVGTNSVKMKSGHTKFDKKHTKRGTQSITNRTRKSNKLASRKGHGDNKVPPKYRQGVRFGSDVTFNIEFFKERPSGDATDFENTGKNNTVKSIASKQSREKSQGKAKSKSHNAANTASPKTHDAKDGTSLLKRCFCTLKLKKAVTKKTLKGHNSTSERRKNKGQMSFTDNKSDTCVTNICSGKKKVRKKSAKTNGSDGNTGSDNKEIKSSSKFITRIYACDENTCLDDNDKKYGKDMKGRRKRSKNMKVHKGKYDLAVKSDISKKGTAKAAKRLTKSFGCELHTCNSDSSAPNEVHKKVKFLKGDSNKIPKTESKAGIIDINKDKKDTRLSLIQKCQCAVAHKTEDNRHDLSQNHCERKALKKHKSKFKTQVDKENCDLGVGTGIVTIMPPPRKSLLKRGGRIKSKRQIAADLDKNEHVNNKPCKCLRSKENPDSAHLNKNTKQLKKSQPFSPNNNIMEIGKMSKTQVKLKTKINQKQSKSAKARANLVKTERNGYSFEIHGKNCRCSHCAEGEIDNNVKDGVKKRDSKKKVKLDNRPGTNTSYHGLYPCICSDKEITKKPSNKSGKVNDGVLCPMCKHCKDKEPLLATLLASGKLLMERLNNFVATIRSKCEKPPEDQPSPPEIPLFEMVVNKGDMSIMNKAEIIEKVKHASEEDQHMSTPISPSFEIVIDKSDASIKDTDDIRKKIMASAKPNRVSHSKSMKSKSLKYETPMKPPVKGTKSERQAYTFQIHGKNCKCCYCANKGRRKRDSLPATGLPKNKAFMDGMPAYSKKTTKRGPCICGSAECKMELQQEKQNKLEEEKRAKQKPCVCGSKICGDISKKFTKSAVRKGTPKKKTKGKGGKGKKEKPKPKSQKPDLTALGELLCGKIGFREFKYKIKVETEHEKRERIHKKKSLKTEEERRKTKKRHAKEDAERRKTRIKNDKSAMKDVKRYKNTPDCLLCAESCLDVAKLGVSAISGVLRCGARAIGDPKSSAGSMKELSKDPERAFRIVKETIASSGVAGTAKRIKLRIGSMRRTQECIAKMESNPVTNYMVHFADKDPKKRLVKHKERKRVRVPLDFECSLFMGSLRKKPHLWVYYMCPWFYPHCLSLVGVWRQFTDVLLFLLAVAVWSPCIFAMEACRALMCCFLCTG